MPYTLGIDLGTTFSAAAVARNGAAEILSLGYRSPTLPSVIVARESGEILIGEAAERRAMIEPLRTAREFKRRLGDPTPILLGSAPYGAETLMSYLLRGIYDLVLEQQGEAPSSMVISHPANWGLYKLDLLEQAVRMADVERTRYVTEPVAAALHYAGRERIEAGEIVAVYDFGGGTFDAALLRRTETSFEPLGEPEGIERLGGIDFDEAVFGHVMQSISDLAQNLDPSDSAAMAAVARLRDECRQAKEALSVDTDVIIPVMLPNVQTEVRLTRSEFEEMVEPRIGATIAALRRAARSASVDLSEVDRILLVGGSSRIPLVRQRVREETSSEIFLDAHPKYAIALGAAIAADLNLGTTTTARMTAQAAPRVQPPPPAVLPSVPELAPKAPPIVEPVQDEQQASPPPPHEPEPEPVVAPLPLVEAAAPELVEIVAPSALQAALDAATLPDGPAASARIDASAEPIVEPDTSEIETAKSVVVPESVAPAGSPADEIATDRFAPEPDSGRVSVDAEGVASAQWQDGIALSPMLIASLLVVGLVSAVVMFLILSALVD